MKNRNIRKELQKRNLNLNTLEYEISPYIYLSIKIIDNDLCYKEFKIYKNKTYITYQVSKKMLETDTVTFRKYLKNYPINLNKQTAIIPQSIENRAKPVTICFSLNPHSSK